MHKFVDDIELLTSNSCLHGKLIPEGRMKPGFVIEYIVICNKLTFGLIHSLTYTLDTLCVVYEIVDTCFGSHRPMKIVCSGVDGFS